MGDLADELGYPPDSRLPRRDPSVVRNITPRTTTDEDIDGWMDAADLRDNPIWQQMDTLLTELRNFYPVHVKEVRRNIKWLRHMAHKHDLDWGKHKRDRT
jgi:hypothetical protein